VTTAVHNESIVERLPDHIEREGGYHQVGKGRRGVGESSNGGETRQLVFSREEEANGVENEWRIDVDEYGGYPIHRMKNERITPDGNGPNHWTVREPVNSSVEGFGIRHGKKCYKRQEIDEVAHIPEEIMPFQPSIEDDSCCHEEY